jgi:uncharacterized protein (DUF983 family)
VNEVAENQEPLRCPHCDSHELFEKVAGYMSICLVCFKVMKREDKPAKRKFSWPRVAIIGGVVAAVMASGAFAAAAMYEWHQAQQTRKTSPTIVNLASSTAPIDEQMAGRLNPFGDKPWYKGFMDRADSCEQMAPDVTPRDDLKADGGHAYAVHADADKTGYSIFYTTGQRTWVYASSENECRKAVDSWIWSHTIGGAL